jgi:hypothetical protein
LGKNDEQDDFMTGKLTVHLHSLALEWPRQVLTELYGNGATTQIPEITEREFISGKEARNAESFGRVLRTRAGERTGHAAETEDVDMLSNDEGMDSDVKCEL